MLHDALYDLRAAVYRLGLETSPVLPFAFNSTTRNRTGLSNRAVELKYLDLTVLRRGVGDVLVVAGRAPAC
jgi:hypothetical protein